MTGLTIMEMPHRGMNTVCCGEGGSVGLLSPDLAGRWRALRASEAGDRRIITYCAGCINMLGPGAGHVLDLVFQPDATMAGRANLARPPLTYWNRLRLKSTLQKSPDNVLTGRRAFPVEEVRRTSLARFLQFFALKR
jgi:hypothetical protein